MRSSAAEGRLLRLWRESAAETEVVPRTLHRALKLGLRGDLSLLLPLVQRGRSLPTADVDQVFTKIARGALALERRQIPPAANRLQSHQIAPEALASIARQWPKTPPILWLECSGSLLALWPDAPAGILALHFAFQSTLIATEWRATSAESLSPPE